MPKKEFKAKAFKGDHHPLLQAQGRPSGRQVIDKSGMETMRIANVDQELN